jgi:hypothetical protein
MKYHAYLILSEFLIDGKKSFDFGIYSSPERSFKHNLPIYTKVLLEEEGNTFEEAYNKIKEKVNINFN